MFPLAKQSKAWRHSRETPAATADILIYGIYIYIKILFMGQFSGAPKWYWLVLCEAQGRQHSILKRCQTPFLGPAVQTWCLREVLAQAVPPAPSRVTLTMYRKASTASPWGLSLASSKLE